MHIMFAITATNELLTIILKVLMIVKLICVSCQQWAVQHMCRETRLIKFNDKTNKPSSRHTEPRSAHTWTQSRNLLSILCTCYDGNAQLEMEREMQIKENLICWLLVNATVCVRVVCALFMSLVPRSDHRKSNKNPYSSLCRSEAHRIWITFRFPGSSGQVQLGWNVPCISLQAK